MKIIKTNLKCVSISNLSIDYFLNKNTDTNPFLLMKKFIFKIFEIYHNNNNENTNENNIKTNENKTNDLISKYNLPPSTYITQLPKISNYSQQTCNLKNIIVFERYLVPEIFAYCQNQ